MYARRSLAAKIIGPTSTRGARWKVYDYEQADKSITRQNDTGLNTDDFVHSLFEELRLKLGWTGKWHMGATKEGFVYVCEVQP